MKKNTQEIFLAGGSFWGIERFLQLITGVIETTVGYANSSEPFPSYDAVCSGRTGAVETVRVTFDTEQIDLLTLIDLFFKGTNCTASEHHDSYSQYRRGIYYQDEKVCWKIENHINALTEAYGDFFGVEVMELDNFYPAEEYHQNYLLRNPNAYCPLSPSSFVLAQSYRPKVYKKQDDAKLQKTLTSTEYIVTQENATETPYTNKYCDLADPGIYVDVTTGEPLFTSKDKITEKQCGWPTFSSPISEEILVKKACKKDGLVVVEVRSALGDAHLGFMYSDGPYDRGGLRYCINSAALRFIPLKWMESFGYGEYAALC